MHTAVQGIAADRTSAGLAADTAAVRNFPAADTVCLHSRSAGTLAAAADIAAAFARKTVLV